MPLLLRLLGIEHVSGIIVLSIAENSPAQKAGLKDKDVIVSIDGNKILNSQTVMEMVTEFRPGTTIDFDVLRDGKKITLPVTIEEDPRD